jgi:membrane protein involved in colicin uptake
MAEKRDATGHVLVKGRVPEHFVGKIRSEQKVETKAAVEVKVKATEGKAAAEAKAAAETKAEADTKAAEASLDHNLRGYAVLKYAYKQFAIGDQLAILVGRDSETHRGGGVKRERERERERDRIETE